MSRGLGSEQKAGRELFPSRGPSQTKTARRLTFPDFCAPNFLAVGGGVVFFFTTEDTEGTEKGRTRNEAGAGSVTIRANGSLTLAALRRDWDFGALGAKAQAEACATDGRVEGSRHVGGEFYLLSHWRASRQWHTGRLAHWQAGTLARCALKLVALGSPRRFGARTFMRVTPGWVCRGRLW
jgi:hypothetical protein